jgi:hypothetical protein
MFKRAIDTTERLFLLRLFIAMTVVRSAQATRARRRGQLCAGGVRTRAWNVGGGSGSDTAARLNRRHWRC